MKKCGIVAIAGVMSLLTACTPFKRLQNEEELHNSISGSWTVLHDGHQKIENLTPPAVIYFDPVKNKISGFDGCNKFNGSYVMEQSILKGKVMSTKMGCSDPVASNISSTMQSLFANGAEVVSVNFMGAKVIMLRNKEMKQELRLGNSEQLSKDKK
ncbi:META domain-containing protein [Aeromonas veronii]|nr:META domain-containing protein [Aeromonas veronii]KRV80694.1 hypothetical protein AO718_20185 [Aeromonas veronii]KRW01897.1 hypothetical protein AO725_15485 [Aeromonas veronii]KRW10896.1 hypothetical protein AO745_16165 [Aeromonas veronii]KRW13026.1 hypothetical protein AO722_10470 [Aeromonas veronii]KRW15817.1 hypothetical protein AO732_01005 [Aeromonas veronii]